LQQRPELFRTFLSNEFVRIRAVGQASYFGAQPAFFGGVTALRRGLSPGQVFDEKKSVLIGEASDKFALLKCERSAEGSDHFIDAVSVQADYIKIPFDDDAIVAVSERLAGLV